MRKSLDDKGWGDAISENRLQVFIGFANFHGRFIRGFSRIAAPRTLMLNTTLLVSSPASGGAPRGAYDEIGIAGIIVVETLKNIG